MLTLDHLQCELATNPLGIDTALPRLSWRATSSRRGAQQRACHILAASSPELLRADRADLWDSGQLPIGVSPLVPWGGAPLGSAARVWWKVRAWDETGVVSPFSAPAWFETALLDPADWRAEWIGFPGAPANRALCFRASFTIAQPVVRARAWVCGLGWHEFTLNGHKPDTRVLDPAQTDVSKRILYTTHDLTPFVVQGENVAAALVGSGWDAPPRLLAQIAITLADGTTHWVLTGRQGEGGTMWRVAQSAIVENSVFDGEVFDARLEIPGWNLPQAHPAVPFDYTHFPGAMRVPAPGGRLVAQMVEPIVVTADRAPEAITEPRPGVYVFDFGQNFAGWAALRVRADAGRAITLRYAEVLREDGCVNQDNLRSARARDVYIARGGGEECWEPRFTYHGFRYVQVEGLPVPPDAATLTGRVVRSGMAECGDFSCSDPFINRLHSAIQWTERSNLIGIPTDCPQRNERMGWLNDMTARTEELLCNFDAARLLSKWVGDIADAQSSDGAITDTAPYRWGSQPADPVSVSYLLIPWMLYVRYGDGRTMERHYSGLRAWVDYLTRRAHASIVEYSYYGDWASPIGQSRPDSIGDGAVALHTPGALVSTAHYAWSIRLLARIARALGYTADADTCTRLLETVRAAFHARFYDAATGGYGTNNQACNAIALFCDLAPPEAVARVVGNLVEDVLHRSSAHVTTGNLATKYLMEVLAAHGKSDAALALLLQESYPSWGYMLANGATTIWERWELNTSGGMNSHNHPMYGAVGAWLYRWLAGLQVDEEAVGCSHLHIRPIFAPQLQFAAARLDTVRGRVECGWARKNEGALTLDVTLPIGCHADLHLPEAILTGAVSEGGTVIWQQGTPAMLPDGIGSVTRDADGLHIRLLAGTYHFRLPANT